MILAIFFVLLGDASLRLTLSRYSLPEAWASPHQDLERHLPPDQLVLRRPSTARARSSLLALISTPGPDQAWRRPRPKSNRVPDPLTSGLTRCHLLMVDLGHDVDEDSAATAARYY